MDESRYVTLNEIKEIMKKGEEVQIIDDATGEDITSVVLTQILHTVEKKERALPQEGLKWLLKYGGEALEELISNIQNIRKEAEKQIKTFVKKGKESASEEIKKTFFDALKEIRNTIKSFIPISTDYKKTLGEIKEIKKRLKRMEKRILKLEKNRK